MSGEPAEKKGKI